MYLPYVNYFDLSSSQSVISVNSSVIPLALQQMLSMMVKFFGVSCISTGFQQAVISKSAIWKVQERQLPVYQVRTLAREIIKP